MNPDYSAPPEAVLIPAVSIVRPAPEQPGLPPTGHNPVPAAVVAVMLIVASLALAWMAYKLRKAASK